jgi:hypothetical protein
MEVLEMGEGISAMACSIDFQGEPPAHYLVLIFYSWNRCFANPAIIYR